MPASTSSTTNMSLVLTSTTELASSYDIHSSSEEAAISQYQQCSDEAGIRNYKQLLEDIPEDGLDHSNISIWIQRADSLMLELFKKELVAMIDRSIQEISSKHGQEQESDMHRLLKLADVMTMLPMSPDLLPTILRLYMAIESFPVNQVNGIANELKKCVRNILHRLCSLSQNGPYNVMNYVKILWEHDGVLNIVLAQDVGESENPLHDEEWTRVDHFVQYLVRRLDTLFERTVNYEFKGSECIYLLNNAYFILKELHKLEMKSALQQNWILKYNNLVEHQITRYLDLSWQPVCSCLDAYTWTQVLFPCFHPHPLTTFYTILERTCGEQQNWRIEDPNLRNKVRKAVSSQVVQCYRAYLQKRSVKLQKNAFYTPQQLENKLMELFEG